MQSPVKTFIRQVEGRDELIETLPGFKTWLSNTLCGHQFLVTFQGKSPCHKQVLPTFSAAVPVSMPGDMGLPLANRRVAGGRPGP